MSDLHHVGEKGKGLCHPSDWNAAGSTSLTEGAASEEKPSGLLTWCAFQERSQHYLTWEEIQKSSVLML